MAEQCDHAEEDKFRDIISHLKQSSTRRRLSRRQDCVRPMTENGTSTERKVKTAATRSSSMIEYVPITPHYKEPLTFYKLSRIALLMQRVCKTLREDVLHCIDGEYWYEPIKKSIRQYGDASLFNEQSGRKPRPFVTFLSNDKTNEVTQLTFDKALFSRNHTADYFLTDEVREVLRIPPQNRSHEDNSELMRFMKRASTAYQKYPFSIQKQLAECMVYDRYLPNRMIIKEGLMADAIYFVLSGYLYGRDEETKDMVEIRPGDGYGEEDIKCGCARRATLITTDVVELVSVHQKDYRTIFNMAQDTTDARCLEICKRHIVFQHFPMHLFEDNPDVWTVLSYKFGRLMVKDSNNMEWIYVIKSGEARVIKNLKTGMWDPGERRKKIAKQTEAQDKYHQTMQRIDFIAQRDHVKSHYKIGEYHPAEQLRTASAPPVFSHPLETSMAPRSPQLLRNQKSACPQSTKISKHLQKMQNFRNLLDPRKRITIADRSDDLEDFMTFDPDGNKTLNFLRTPSLDKIMLPNIDDRKKSISPRKEAMEPVPPFVQLESLHTGGVFGLRSCLAAEERGPSVSLVSGGCTVIRISKKFFLTHADEAIVSLIRFKTKAFPEEDELLDRLDVNYQWQEYKQTAMTSFLKTSRKYGRSYKYDLTVLT